MSDRLLELQLELLIARHGKQIVVRALAVATGMTVDELEGAIAELPKRKPKRPVIRTAEELIRREFQARQELLPVVTRLIKDYENRAFLPQLRDVQRFLERLGVTNARLKSRVSATSNLIRALAQMSDSEIEALVGETGRTESNDFELLAREIMGQGARQRRDKSSTP